MQQSALFPNLPSLPPLPPPNPPTQTPQTLNRQCHHYRLLLHHHLPAAAHCLDHLVAPWPWAGCCGLSTLSRDFSRRNRPAASRIWLNSMQNACTSMNMSFTHTEVTVEYCVVGNDHCVQSCYQLFATNADEILCELCIVTTY